MKKTIKVGLLFHSFSSSNMGVGALAISESRLLKKICDDLAVELEIICFEAKVNDLYSNSANTIVKLRQITFNPFKLVKYFNECDLIIDVTGGDSFTDIYGLKNFIAIFLVKFISVISKPPVILAPQTIGPFKRFITKKIANQYLIFVKKIFTRDEISKYTMPNRLSYKIVNVTDMAFALPYKKEVNDRICGKSVGFNISGLLYSGGFNLGRSDNFSYTRLCKNIIELLIMKGYKVYIVPHVVGGMDDSIDNDTKVSLKLCDKDKRLNMAPLFNDPIQAKSYISQFDLFIGSRMHATIASLSTGVPTIPLSYSRKFEGVFKTLGYDVWVDLCRMQEEEILRNIEMVIENIEQISNKVNHAKEIALKKLEIYEEYLKNEVKEFIFNNNKV